MELLYVHFENNLVGTLKRLDDLLYSFQYEPTWINSSNAFPLSLALPLMTETFGNKATLSFFENLLPEGQVREELEKINRVEGVFALLKEFGRDCAGAVTLSSKAESKLNTKAPKLISASLDKIYKAINEKQNVASVISSIKPGYLSLAGAQDKFAAVFKDARIYLPQDGSPTTHIVKTPIWRQGVKDSVYNEYYCMLLARRIGLKIPNVQIVEGKFPLFVIDRYDRFIDSEGIVHRIHQQDFCQAQGLISEHKYESSGGPGIRENYELIKIHVSPKHRLEAVTQYLAWISFNLIVGNNDSHSKNLSLLMRNGIELAPFYDLICTAIYPDLDRSFSYKLGDRYAYDKIGPVQFKQCEDALKIKRGTLQQIFQEVSIKIIQEKDSLAQLLLEQFPKMKIFSRISDLIDKRLKAFRFQKLL